MVTVSETVFVCPTVTVPKLRGEVPAESEPGVTPVAVSGMLSDEFEASLATVKVVLAAPALVGPNTTLKLVLAPAARVIGKVAPVTL